VRVLLVPVLPVPVLLVPVLLVTGGAADPGVAGRGRTVARQNRTVSRAVAPRRPLTDQLGEELPVVHQGLAQLLGGCLAALVALDNVVRLPIPAQRVGVLDRQLSHLLVEVVSRVAAFGHQSGEQLV